MSSRFYRRRNNFRYSGNGRRRYSNFSSGSSVVKRARGNLKAASQQNDTSNVVINLMSTTYAGVHFFSGSNAGTAVNYTPDVAAVDIYDMLYRSDFYASYANMYDQFRITSIKVKVTPTTWKTYDQFNVPTVANAAAATATPALPADSAANAGGYIYPQALTIITAWDRTGLDKAQFLRPYTAGNNADQEAFYITNIGDAISSYSSAKSQQLVGDAVFNCTRYLYPSSQQEKSLYLSTSDLQKQFQKKTGTDADYYKYTLEANTIADSEELTNPLDDASIPFKPVFLIGVLGSNNATATFNKIHPITFNLEFDFGVTFRGLRKAQVV